MNLYDVIESAVDYIGIGSANSKQADKWLSETENLKVHAHSQGTLILEQGAKNNPNRGHTYNTFGNPWRPFQAEGSGLRAKTLKYCDQTAYLPMMGQTQSLNVSHATTVALFESIRQRTRE